MSAHPLRLALFAATLPVALSACSASEPASEPVSGGQALFEANCQECHGAGARGDGPLAGSLPVRPPSILEHLGHHTEDQLVRLIQAGIPPAMPPAPIDADQIREVLAYAWTLLPEAERARMRAVQDSVASGLIPPGMPATPAPTEHPGP
jgi:mono/diheme cytochrome c family protein